MKQLQELLMNTYGIRVLNIEPISAGVLNRNYLVTADAGQRFVLKQYASDIYDSAAVERACTYQMHCGKLGIPVAEVVSNREGGWQTRSAGNSYVVSRFVEGEPYSRPHVPRQAAYAMGETLGALQGVMQNFPEVKPYHLPTPDEAMARLRKTIRLGGTGSSLRHRRGGKKTRSG